MAELPPYPDNFVVRAARGWLELGNHREAEAELTQVNPAHREHPEVLELRFQVVAGQKRFAECLEIARRQIEAEPTDHRGHMNVGNALFWLDQAQAAHDEVAAVLERFPTVSALPYNLACYAVRLGELDQARQWLDRSFAIGRKENIIAYALTDPDLKSLWAYLRKLTAD
jgi:predicted Zn-dependent protease